MEDQAALRSGGVDALLEHLDVNAALGEIGGHADVVLQGPHRAGQAGDRELVSGPEPAQSLVELGTAGQFPARPVGVDLVAPGRLERITLAVRVLVPGRYPAVADTVTAAQSQRSS